MSLKIFLCLFSSVGLLRTTGIFLMIFKTRVSPFPTRYVNEGPAKLGDITVPAVVERFTERLLDFLW